MNPSNNYFETHEKGVKYDKYLFKWMIGGYTSVNVVLKTSGLSMKEGVVNNQPEKWAYIYG